MRIISLLPFAIAALVAFALSGCAGLCGYHGPRGCESDNTWKSITEVMKRQQ